MFGHGTNYHCQCHWGEIYTSKLKCEAVSAWVQNWKKHR